MDTPSMIKRLVDDDIATIKNAMAQNDFEYLYHILHDGIGYNNMTSIQVEIEYNERSWEDA